MATTPHAGGAGSRGTSRGPARQESLREHNMALVLGQVAEHGPASRARLAAATGLTKATVSSLVEALLAARLLEARGRDTGAVGRPGQFLGLGTTGPVGVGLEINVDYVATCTVDLTGAVRGREVVTGDLRTLPEQTVLERAAAAVRRALDHALTDGRTVAGVGVAVPGLVAAGSDELLLAPNLGWHRTPVADRLRDLAALSGMPVTVQNEADLAALGELWCGGHLAPDGGPLRTFLHVSGEVGVGAGLVVDGRLFTGQHGLAGEIGHLPVAPEDSARCRCGAGGCLEAVAGQEALLRGAGLPEQPGTAIGSPQGPLEELLRRLVAGEPRAVGVVERAAAALGTAVCAVVNLVDVDTVVLGGIYAPLSPWLVPVMEREVGRRLLVARVPDAPVAPLRLLRATLAGDGAVRGAAVAVVRRILADPAGYALPGPRIDVRVPGVAVTVTGEQMHGAGGAGPGVARDVSRVGGGRS